MIFYHRTQTKYEVYVNVNSANVTTHPYNLEKIFTERKLARNVGFLNMEVPHPQCFVNFLLSLRKVSCDQF